MNVIALPMGAGKTTMLIDWARAKPNRVVLVSTFGEAALFPEDVKVMVYPYRGDMRGRIPHNSEVAVDNLENLLVSVLGTVPSVVTVTKL